MAANNQITVCVISTSNDIWYVEHDLDDNRFYIKKDGDKDCERGSFASKQDAILHIICELNLNQYNEINFLIK